MGKILSNDLRYRLIKNVESGLSARAAARKLDIAASTATRIVRQWHKTGSYEAGRRGGHRPCLLEPIRNALEELIEVHGDWSEEELCAHIKQEHGIFVHAVTVGRFIRKLGFRYKKNYICQRTKA